MKQRPIAAARRTERRVDSDPGGRKVPRSIAGLLALLFLLLLAPPLAASIPHDWASDTAESAAVSVEAAFEELERDAARTSSVVVGVGTTQEVFWGSVGLVEGARTAYGFEYDVGGRGPGEGMGSGWGRRSRYRLFQSLYTDPVSGISYARNRWYDARTGVWLSEDPMGDVDSPSLYAFVGQSPAMGTDPLGLYCRECTEETLNRKRREVLQRKQREAVETMQGGMALVDQLQGVDGVSQADLEMALHEYLMGRPGVNRAEAAALTTALAGTSSEGLNQAFVALEGVGDYADFFTQALVNYPLMLAGGEAAFGVRGFVLLAREVGFKKAIHGLGAALFPAVYGGNSRHLSQVASIEELDALVLRLGDRALRETERAGLKGRAGGVYAESLFDRYLVSLDARLARYGSRYTIELQPATLPGVGRVPAFVEYSSGWVGAYPGSLRLDASISDAYTTVRTLTVSVDTYPLVLRGYDVTVSTTKPSAVAKYTGPFRAPIRDIRPR